MNEHTVCENPNAFAMKCATYVTVSSFGPEFSEDALNDVPLFHSTLLHRYINKYPFTVDTSDIQFWSHTLESIKNLSFVDAPNKTLYLNHFKEAIEDMISELRVDSVSSPAQGLSRYKILKNS